MRTETTSFRASKLEDWEIAAAKTLRRLFDERAGMTQKSFGQEFGIGTPGMVSQYLNAKRPIGLQVAIKFAKGLDVSIAEISPRLAAQLPTVSNTKIEPLTHTAREPKAAYQVASLGQTLADLSRHLSTMDAGTRRKAMALISDLANEPESHPTVTAMIELSIRSKVQKVA